MSKLFLAIASIAAAMMMGTFVSVVTSASAHRQPGTTASAGVMQRVGDANGAAKPGGYYSEFQPSRARPRATATHKVNGDVDLQRVGDSPGST